MNLLSGHKSVPALQRNQSEIFRLVLDECRQHLCLPSLSNSHSTRLKNYFSPLAETVFVSPTRLWPEWQKVSLSWSHKKNTVPRVPFLLLSTENQVQTWQTEHHPRLRSLAHLASTLGCCSLQKDLQPDSYWLSERGFASIRFGTIHKDDYPFRFDSSNAVWFWMVWLTRQFIELKSLRKRHSSCSRLRHCCQLHFMHFCSYSKH